MPLTISVFNYLINLYLSCIWRVGHVLGYIDADRGNGIYHHDFNHVIPDCPGQPELVESRPVWLSAAVRPGTLPRPGPLNAGSVAAGQGNLRRDGHGRRPDWRHSRTARPGSSAAVWVMRVSWQSIPAVEGVVHAIRLSKSCGSKRPLHRSVLHGVITERGHATLYWPLPTV